MAVNFGVYLVLEHAWALVPLARLLVSFELLDLYRLVRNNLFEVADAAVIGLALPQEGLAAVRAVDLGPRAISL